MAEPAGETLEPIAGPAPSAEGAGGTWVSLRRLGGQSSLYLIGDALSKSLALILLPLYLSVLTPADYAILAIATTVTVLLTLLLGFALQGALQRLYFELSSDGERSTLYASIFAFIVVVPGLAVVALELLGRGGQLELFPSVPFDPYLRLAILTAYLGLFREIPVAIYTVRGQAARVLAILLSNALLTAGLTVVFVIIADDGALGAVRAAFLAALAVGVVCVGLTIHESRPQLSWNLLRISLGFSIPLIPHLVGHWGLALADRAVLDQFVSAADVGTYSLGATVATGAALLATATGRAFTPELTREMKTDIVAPRVAVLGTWWVAAMVWGCLAVALLAGPLIRLLFDDSYASATEVVPWLVAGYLALGFYNVVTQGTWFSMRMKLVPVITLFAGAVNIALAITLVPALGPVGAAIATLVGFVVLATLQGLLSQRLHPISWEYGRWAKLLVAAGICFALGSLTGVEPTPLAVSTRLMLLVLGLPGLLLLMRFFSDSERGAVGAYLIRLRLRTP